MKKVLATVGAGLAATFAACMASSAQAAAPMGNWYAGLSGDLTWLSHSDTGGGGNVNIGYRFWPSDYGDFRIEGEAGYHGANGQNGYSNTHYFTYMGNLYYDFNSMFPAASGSGWHVVPYVGGGIGDAEVHYGSNHNAFTDTFHHHENDFAYQGMAGLSFASASMPGTDWSIGYRYLGTDTSNLHSNSVELGVRFHF